jgi:uncharacterized membrane protein YhaH (DUF805 family)
MLSKVEILMNLREYSSDQIAEAVNSGVVTMYELSKSGNLTPLMRKRIEEKLSVLSLSVKSENADKNLLDDKEINEFNKIPINDIGKENITLNTDIQGELTSINEIGDSNRSMFSRPFSFKGRIRRLEYGLSFILYSILYFIIQALEEKNEIAILLFIPLLWFIWAQGCKRCHDRGCSGWFQIIPFFSLVLIFFKGEEGNNKYGSNPKK